MQEHEEPHVTEVLVGTYGRLAGLVGDLAIGSGGSPSQLWDIELQEPERLYERALRQYAEMAAVQAEAAAIAHLRLLARAYWPNLTSPSPEDPEDWPSEAVFPPARAVLEALAIVGWLLKPDVEGMERLDRVGKLMVWSTRDWIEVVERAGVEVPRDQRGRPILLSMKELVEDVFGTPGYELYKRWSKTAHNDPLPAGDMRMWMPRPDGRIAVARELREDTHLLVVAELADAIGVTGRRRSDYFGRPFDAQVKECREISDRFRSMAAEIRPQIIDRNARTTVLREVRAFLNEQQASNP